MSQHLDRHYWDNRYTEQNTGWDLGQPSPALCRFMDSISDRQVSVLIPGCGNAYEAAYLHARGFEQVHLLDISPLPLKQFLQRIPDFPQEHVHCIDFFQHRGSYDLILEQTFFCALDPSLRDRYAQHMKQLLKPGGKLVGLLFATRFDAPGPPFGGEESEYRNVFAPHFRSVALEPCTASIPARSGRELWMECQRD
ncbi:MAG: methyltransferase [Bacteroidota bacterium]